MRVLVLTHLFPRQHYPDYGLHPYNIVLNLPAQVLVITRRLPDALWPVPPKVSVKEINYADSRMQWMSRTPFHSVAGIVQAAIGQAVLAARLLKPARQFRPDVIHSYGAVTLAAGMAARAVTGAPLVVTLLGTDFPRIRKNRLLQHWLGLTDKVLGVSKSMYVELCRFLPSSKVHCCSPGVDVNTFRPLGVPRKKQLIAIGRLVRAKRYDKLIRAMPPVLAAHPGYSLLLVGRGPLEQSLRQLVIDLEIEARVCFLGVVGREEVASLLGVSKLFVMSSDWEGTPKALLEALACGTPAVVTDVGECARLVQGAGRVAVNHSPEAIADAILSVLGSDMWESFSRQAVANATAYSWPQVTKKVHEVYSTLLTERGMNVDAQ